MANFAGYITNNGQIFNASMSSDGKMGPPGPTGPTGAGVSSVELIATQGKVNTYRMHFTNGTFFDYQVTDGADGNGGTGSGDMTKLIYDANDNGTVDNAEKVNGHNVYSDVPENAKFTDTVYDDTEIKNALNNKVEKIAGKGLSTNDYTTDEKEKLNSLPSNPLTSETDPTVPSWAKAPNKPTYTYGEITEKPSIPTTTSQLTNDSSFISSTIITAFWTGTQAEYDALGSYSPTTLYLIKEE